MQAEPERVQPGRDRYQWRPAFQGECQVCGWGPAQLMTARRTTGIVIGWLGHWETHGLCRTCGESLAADAQAHCLVAGWWGPLAFVVNLVTLLRNGLALRRHRRDLGPPSFRDPYVVTPADDPLPVRPVLSRPLAVLGLLAVAAAVAFYVVLLVNDGT